MAIKRMVTITCDGPCGTVVNDSKVPPGWEYLQIMPAHNIPGQKTPKVVAALCVRCTATAKRILGQAGFAFTTINTAVNPHDLAKGEAQQKEEIEAT